MVSYEAAIYRAYSIYLPQMIAVWKVSLLNFRKFRSYRS